MRKKIFALIMALIMAAVPVNAAERITKNADAIFKPISGCNGIEFGTSKDDVINIVITDDMVLDSDYQLLEDADGSMLFITNQKVSRFDTTTSYYFEDDKLYSVAYNLRLSHTTFTQYLLDFYDLVDVYESVYGKGETTIDIWYDDLFKSEEESEIAFAIARGDLSKYVIWNGSDDSSVLLYANGKDNKISLAAVYRDKDHNPLKSGEKKNTNGV